MSEEEKNDSVLASLNDLDLKGDGEAAKVKKRARGKVKEQKWVSDESAEGLLAGLLGETEAEAAAERERVEAELKAREEAEARKRAEEEARRKAEAERELAAERERVQKQQLRRTQMVAAIERQKKIESGEIDEEEERRKKEEEAERLRLEALEKQAKEAELQQSQALIQEQRKKLEELSTRSAEPQIIEQKSNTGVIIAIAGIVAVLVGGAIAFVILSGDPEEMQDPLAVDDSVTVSAVALDVEEPQSAMLDMALKVVSQRAGMKVTTIAATEKEESDDTRSSRKKRRRRGGDSSKKKKNDFKDLGGKKGGNVLGGKGGGIVF